MKIVVTNPQTGHSYTGFLTPGLVHKISRLSGLMVSEVQKQLNIGMEIKTTGSWYRKATQ